MAKENCTNMTVCVTCSACDGCYACNACDSCRACDGCYACNACDSCDACYACYACYACRACYACEQVKNSIFCYEIECAKNMIFNKQTSEERVDEVKLTYNKLCGEWLPLQTNGYQLYKEAGNDWTKVDISKLETIDWYDSWKDMPKAAIDYISSLPEFDAAIFKEITGLDVSKPEPSLSGQEVEVKLNGKTYKAKIL